ncbi:MAG: peptidase S10, partial [Myxococcota bacterium]
RELMRDERRTVGRLDSRFVGPEYDGAGDSMERDPSLSALSGVYASAFHHDVRSRRGYDDEVYELLNLKVNRGWTYPPMGFLDVAPRLRSAMHANAHLRVLAVSGLYDLATPPFATEYTLAHLGIDPSLQEQVRHVVYPAGHMMYAHEPSMDALRDDLLRFYRE